MTRVVSHSVGLRKNVRAQFSTFNRNERSSLLFSPSISALCTGMPDSIAVGARTRIDRAQSSSLHRRLMIHRLARFLPEHFCESESEVPNQAEDIRIPVIRP
jgi:hypothetical protein